jgi:hypothetical protein
MEFLRKVNALVLGLAVLLVVSCGEDEKTDPAPAPTPRTCKVTQLNGSDFIYDNTGKLVRINWVGIKHHQEIFYNAAGNISEIKDFDNSNVYISRQVYNYNAFNLPERIYSYFLNTSGLPSELNVSYFQYNAAKQLVKTIYYKTPNYPLPDTVTENYSLFTHLSGNHVVEKYYAKDWNGILGLATTREMNYDNMKNPYHLIGYLDTRSLISPHNLTSTTYPGSTDTYTITYSYNTDGYPTQQTVFLNGQLAPMGRNDRWTYSCQ